MVDLLLFSHSPVHPITGVEAWELELGETVKHAGATSAGVGGCTCRIGGNGVVGIGRGRKVCAKVGGGVGEGSKSIEEKDDDERKGKGKAEGSGKEDVEESVVGKGKAQESAKGEEEESNEREKEDVGEERKPDLWSVFDLDPPHEQPASSAFGSRDTSALNLGVHSTLDSHSHTLEEDISNSTENDLTALHTRLTTH